MTYFRDLSGYTYLSQFARPNTTAVGWLSSAHGFPKSPPSDEFLDHLWAFCSISVAQARGTHLCGFCPSEWSSPVFERSGQKLCLGSAEIRVFSEDGYIYAAPNLIYHYVCTHHYQPPDGFVEAVRKGPRPPNHEYFERLETLGLEWRPTSNGEGLRRPPPRSQPKP